jgi:hypothetical protein
MATAKSDDEAQKPGARLHYLRYGQVDLRKLWLTSVRSCEEVDLMPSMTM